MQLISSDDPTPGKILDRNDGLGVADGAQVEQRARELAMIDGLQASGVTDAHRHQAREELRGVVDPTVSNDDEGLVSELTSEDDVIGESGGSAAPATHAATHADEMTVGERLYSEGVDEADHDRMTQSRRQEQRDAY